MSKNQVSYPSLRRRLLSYPLAGLGTVHTAPFVIAGSAIAIKLSHINMTLSSVVGYSVMFIPTFHILWKHLCYGMMPRHLVMGYRIVSAETGRPLNPILFALREIVSALTSILVFFKAIMPALMKRSLTTHNDDHHVVARGSNDNLLVSKKNLGQMRDDQMGDEMSAAAQKELLSIAENGFFHDRLFKTVAIRTDRLDFINWYFLEVKSLFGITPKENTNKSKETIVEKKAA